MATANTLSKQNAYGLTKKNLHFAPFFFWNFVKPQYVSTQNKKSKELPTPNQPCLKNY